MSRRPAGSNADAPLVIQVDATGVSHGGAGIVTYLRGLIRGWKQAGFEDYWIVQATSDLAGGIVDELNGLGEVHRFGSGAPPVRIAIQQLAIPLRMLQRRPDVLLCTTPVVPIATLSTPVVSVVHDLRHLARPEDFSPFQNRYRRHAWRAGMRRSTLIISDSERTRDDLATHYPFAGPKISTVPLGSDHVPNTAASSEAGHGIAFARWPNKRPDFAIRTWAELNHRQPGLDRRLHIIGSVDEERPRLIHLAGELGVGELVRVHPYLPEDRFWDLFASAGIVLFPSFFEGFGLPVLEAMRLRVPVVTWRDPAVVELAGDCVWYAEPSPEEFAAAADKILTTPEPSGGRIERAYERACALTWRATAESTRKVLMNAVAGVDT